MTEYIYNVDDELVPASKATVSVQDRGFKYGDAAFETLRSYGGIPFEWKAHYDRLERTCETLGFGDAMPPAGELRGRIDETLAANDIEDAYVRISVTRGVQPGKLTPGSDVDPTIVVIVSELPRGGTDGKRVWDGSAAVRTVDRRRAPENVLPADAKTHNYLPGILARLELRETAADEALMLSTDGYLTEGATSNLFFVADGTLKTPSADLPLLPGITRQVVLDLARELELDFETGRYQPDALPAADEAFLTNSTWEIRPVGRIDDRKLQTGETTKRLQQGFDERVEELYRKSGETDM